MITKEKEQYLLDLVVKDPFDALEALEALRDTLKKHNKYGELLRLQSQYNYIQRRYYKNEITEPDFNVKLTHLIEALINFIRSLSIDQEKVKNTVEAFPPYKLTVSRSDSSFKAVRFRQDSIMAYPRRALEQQPGYYYFELKDSVYNETTDTLFIGKGTIEIPTERDWENVFRSFGEFDIATSDTTITGYNEMVKQGSSKLNLSADMLYWARKNVEGSLYSVISLNSNFTQIRVQTNYAKKCNYCRCVKTQARRPFVVGQPTQ